MQYVNPSHQEDYSKLLTVHNRVSLRIIGAHQKTRPSDDFLQPCPRDKQLDARALEQSTRRLLAIQISGGWLPKRMLFGKFEGAVRRGRGGKEKEEWIDCVQSDVRTFDIIAGD